MLFEILKLFLRFRTSLGNTAVTAAPPKRTYIASGHLGVNLSIIATTAMDSLEWLELSEQKIKDTLKNVALTKALAQVVEFAKNVEKNAMENGADVTTSEAKKQKVCACYNDMLQYRIRQR